MATVLQRSAIGAVLISVFCGLLLLDAWTGRGWGVIVLCVLLALGGSIEVGRMLAPHDPFPYRAVALCGALYMLLRGLGHELDPRLHLLSTPLWLLLAAGLCFASLRGAPSLPRLRGLAMCALTFVYVPVIGSFALEVRFLSPVQGPAAFFFVIAIAKGTDICAFFSGKAFGRVKLVPGVSPGKTTAGFVGAVAGGAAIAALFSGLTSLGEWVPLPLAPGVGMLLALVVISGDLIESFLKRAVDVKDSAQLLPGFGGVMDVIDSVIAVAPAAWYLFSVARALGEGSR